MMLNRIVTEVLDFAKSVQKTRVTGNVTTVTTCERRHRTWGKFSPKFRR